MRLVAVVTTVSVALISDPSAQTRSAPRREAAVPFRVGETLTYDVSWSQYLIAGSASVTIAEKKPSLNSTAYYIVADGKPLPLIARFYSLYYKMDSLVDAFSLLSQRSSLYSEEGAGKRLAITRFDRGRQRAVVEQQLDRSATAELAVPPETQDGLATLYALRSRTFKSGDRTTVPVVDDGVLYRVTMEAVGPERVRVRFGEFESWKLQLTILDPQRAQVGKNIAVWMTTDERRLPLKLQADLPVGNFVLALREVKG